MHAALAQEDRASASSESAFGVLGSSLLLVGLGICVAVLCVLGFALTHLGAGGGGDADVVFRGGVAPLGFLPVEDETYPSRERLRVWKPADSGTAPEAPVDAEDGQSDGKPVEAKAGAPNEILVLDVPSRKAAQAIFEGRKKRPQFGRPKDDGEEDSERLRKWERSPDFAWHSTIRSEELTFGRWRADYRIERSFREDGSWRDAARLDLSSEGVNRLLFLLYPDDVAATEESLLVVCRTLEMGTGSPD